MTISAKTSKVKDANGDPKSATVSLEIPTTTADLIDKYGEDVVAGAAKQHLTVQAQAAIRRLIEAGKTDEEIEQTMSSWVPGLKIAGPPKDPKQAMAAAWAAMSPEEQKEFLKGLQSGK